MVDTAGGTALTTKASRLVLADCEIALRDFVEGANKDVQRSRWLALITLLRTVLDVLHEVDGPSGTRAFRDRIHREKGALFLGHPEPRIFHEFIEYERNGTVHQYRIRARVNVRIKFGGLPWSSVLVTPRGGSARERHDFVMRDGPYAGQDVLKLCGEAIDFWRGYLDRIDEAFSEKGGA